MNTNIESMLQGYILKYGKSPDRITIGIETYKLIETKLDMIQLEANNYIRSYHNIPIFQGDFKFGYYIE